MIALTYEQAKAKRDSLELACKTFNGQLKVIRKSLGCENGQATPDSVKFDQEYQQAKQSYSTAFAQLQAFNARFAKEFKAEIKADRAKRYSA